MAKRSDALQTRDRRKLRVPNAKLATTPDQRCITSCCTASGERCVSRHRDFAGIFRDLIALLGRRPLGDGDVPALDVRVLVEIDRLPFVARYPRPDRDV